MFSNQNIAKNRKEFCCQKCDYNTCNKFDYEKHCKTKKHEMAILAITIADFSSNLSQKSQDQFKCECGKKYRDNSGLWRHRKKCKSSCEVTTELVIELIKDNKEMRNLLMEQRQTIQQQSSTINNLATTNHIGGDNHSHKITNTNSHNKAFNLNFFLNETCKDAMNIMDFVDSIQLQLSDLEKVGEIGYVDGISNIITANLKALDVTQRPIHCTDKKRDVLYVKDQNKWEKEDDEKNKLRKAIKRVACKNQRLIPKFKEAHPDCIKAASKFSDQYNKMIIESMGGSGDNDLEKEDKIIKKITKEVTIDKN